MFLFFVCVMRHLFRFVFRFEFDETPPSCLVDVGVYIRFRSGYDFPYSRYPRARGTGLG